jgi:hypothetical protein
MAELLFETAAHNTSDANHVNMMMPYDQFKTDDSQKDVHAKITSGAGIDTQMPDRK